MSTEWVRRNYGVPATRGGIIRFDGQHAVILSATHLLHVRLDSGECAWIHPTWRVKYQECHETVLDRDGTEQPCGRPAVGYRADHDPDEDPYPVCRRHREAS